jgi:triosephosphate isomerase (TIM)
MRQPLIAGNWKMYKSISEARTFLRSLRARLDTVAGPQVVVCPSFTTLGAAAEELKGSRISLGAQNAHWEKQGAFTGEIAVAMLAEVGCHFVIVGHSERRQYFGETDATVHKRMHAVIAGGLTPIVCIGETLQERESDQTFTVIERQLKTGLAGLSKPGDMVIAYEPVWAIGTGKTATPDQAQEAHAFIRKQFSLLYGEPAAQAVRILYGGSVKPENAGALMQQPDIDGGLVGGACLEVESFVKIVTYDSAAAAAAQ